MVLSISLVYKTLLLVIFVYILVHIYIYHMHTSIVCIREIVKDREVWHAVFMGLQRFNMT